MNKKIQVNQTLFKILYFTYKDYVTPGIVFVIVWILFIFFAIPQIQNFFAEKDAIVANEQSLLVMTQNYNELIAQDPKELQSNLSIATDALPSVKDFAGILTAISNAAGESAVTVNDYTFQIGDLTSQPSAQDQGDVKITLTLNATLDETKQFLIALSNQFPLSDVTSISLVNNGAVVINANFFYSAIPTTPFDPGTQLTPLTAEQKSMLHTLSQNQSILPTAPIVPLATPTAIPTIVPPAQNSSSSAH